MKQLSEHKKFEERTLEAQANRNFLLELIRHNIKDYSLRDRAIFELSFYTSISSEELINLNTSDMDIAIRTVRLKRAKEIVYIPITDKCAILLAEICLPVAQSQTEVPLFINREGKRITLNDLWFIKRNLMGEIGLDCNN
ncbi:tyrosine-type recombinase/integrase [Desulfosporosinus sp. I2]|uniref:tyrosine-type recombinase/integrase n=1 Tax=Desulfosporosinus sp. I2 TaxID=1617025 RepID=UPI0005EDEB24|nr:tyrosine-type recombinase/integrase [Desulfosporosinus sp. I2]